MSRTNSHRWQARAESHRWGSTETGPVGTLDYRVFFIDRQHRTEISPLHNIPIYNRDTLLNFVCKTPRSSKAEYEVSENENLTPLRRSVRWDRPAIFAHNSAGNFGFIPQTYADPSLLNEDYGGLSYDGQALELMDIGSKKRRTGHVYAVKPLCAFGVVSHDVSSISWKVIGIAADDPLAGSLNGSSDIVRHLPGTLENVRQWFRICHCLDSEDKESVFGFNERPAEVGLCLSLISQAHESWRIRIPSEQEVTSSSLDSHSLPHTKPMSPISVLDSSFMGRIHILMVEPSNQLPQVSLRQCDYCSETSCECSAKDSTNEEFPLFTRNESLGSESSSCSSADSNDSYGSDFTCQKRKGNGKGKKVSWGRIETREIPARKLINEVNHVEKLHEVDRLRFAFTALKRKMASGNSKSLEDQCLNQQEAHVHSNQDSSSMVANDVELWHKKSWEAMKKKYTMADSNQNASCNLCLSNQTLAPVCYSH